MRYLYARCNPPDATPAQDLTMKSRPTATLNLFKRTWLARAMAALLVGSAFAAAPHANAGVFLSVNIAPPPLPIYEQPPLPGPGYFFTPGYWDYASDGGYFWVPGTWVRTPYEGALWTPGYWGWNNNAYVFNEGYWGLHIGYYGGINYGFGYTGIGYYGGYWGHGRFFYNSAFNRFGGVHITNVYNRPYNEVNNNHFSFNGPGGVDRRPTGEELTFAHERHTGPGRDQMQQRELARHDESLRASVNHGTPAVMATPRAGAFAHGDAKAAPRAEANRANEHRGTEAHARSHAEAATAHSSHAAANSHIILQHHTHATQPTHASHASAEHRMAPQHHQPAHVAEAHGARPMPAMHSEGPRQNAGPRMQAPRQEGPRGGGERRPAGGEKPKDKDHH
jgi:WXXGXW repeat (2 copies)